MSRLTAEELHQFISNPENVGENKCRPHSEHSFYDNLKEAEEGRQSRLVQSLNGTWKFKYSKNLSLRSEDFYMPDYNVSKFDDIKVPGHIELQGYGIPQYTNVAYPWDGTEQLNPPEVSRDYNPVGSYVLDVKIDRALRDKRIFISFQGVQTGFRLFVNGEYVGYSEDSFTPADFEITDYVNHGKNRIAVEVYNHTSASWLEDQDMWRFFGIFRDVFLYAIPAVHVRDMFVKATLDASYDKGVLDVKADVMGNAESAVLELYDDGKKKIFEAPMTVERNKVSLHMEGLAVRHWSAEIPNLYECRLLLRNAEGEVAEYASTKIGFRTFELKDKIMLLNGKRIVFKGVDRHEFSATGGRVVSMEEMLWDIKTLKRNNINAVRTSHYPGSTAWIKLCDEYGIYLIEETNLETHGTWCSKELTDKNYQVPGSKPEWTKAVVTRAENMVEKDKNHASILLWSLGNEAFGGENFLKMRERILEIDDTRLTHYEGIVHDRDFETASDVESKMYDKPADIKRYLDNNPQKPFISCEYMHAMGNSLGGMKLYTDLEDEYAMYQGGFIWDYLDQALWQDFKGKKRLVYGGDFGDRPCDYCFSTDGIVFADRTESPKIKEAKVLYSNVKVSCERIGITVTNKNLFADLSAYYILYTIREDGRVLFEERFDALNAGPGESVSLVPAAFEDVSPARDYVYRAELKLKEATKWADKDYTVTFGEWVSLAEVNPVIADKCDSDRKFKHTANGLGNAGAVTDDFKVIFGKAWKTRLGGPVSFNSKGRELISVSPVPTYFRAYTDNDKGFNLPARSYFWHMLSQYQLATMVSFEDLGNCVKAVYDYEDPTDHVVYSTVTYTAYPDSRVEVNIKYKGGEGRPILPLFGWEFKIDGEFKNVEYLGKGPFENYRDRDNGASFDLHRSTPADNLTPYLIPQECGNRTKVRYARFTNNEGSGILFAAKEGTFELGFLPYSAYELENATHADELPAPQYTWVRILAGQMGVGGDDSWGAPVHEEFMLDSSADYELDFEIRFF